MTSQIPILAAGQSYEGLIILAVIALISWIARKIQESGAAKRQEQENQAVRKQVKEDEELQQRQAPMRDLRGEVRREQSSRQIASMEPSSPPVPQSRATGDNAFQTQGQRYAGGGSPSAYRRPAPPTGRPMPAGAAGAYANVPPPIPVDLQLRQGDLAQGVDEEMERQQQRMQRERTDREHRMAALAPQEADTAALISHLVHIRPGSIAAGAAHAGPSSRLLSLLKNGSGLRNALIYHEIFSPPKSMRKDQDIWDA
jgi:hypothetical protein